MDCALGHKACTSSGECNALSKRIDLMELEFGSKPKVQTYTISLPAPSQTQKRKADSEMSQSSTSGPVGNGGQKQLSAKRRGLFPVLGKGGIRLGQAKPEKVAEIPNLEVEYPPLPDPSRIAKLNAATPLCLSETSLVSGGRAKTGGSVRMASSRLAGEERDTENPSPTLVQREIILATYKDKASCPFCPTDWRFPRSWLDHMCERHLPYCSHPWKICWCCRRRFYNDNKLKYHWVYAGKGCDELRGHFSQDTWGPVYAELLVSFLGFLQAELKLDSLEELAQFAAAHVHPGVRQRGLLREHHFNPQRTAFLQYCSKKEIFDLQTSGVAEDLYTDLLQPGVQWSLLGCQRNDIPQKSFQTRAALARAWGMDLGQQEVPSQTGQSTASTAANSSSAVSIGEVIREVTKPTFSGVVKETGISVSSCHTGVPQVSVEGRSAKPVDNWADRLVEQPQEAINQWVNSFILEGQTYFPPETKEFRTCMSSKWGLFDTHCHLSRHSGGASLVAAGKDRKSASDQAAAALKATVTCCLVGAKATTYVVEPGLAKDPRVLLSFGILPRTFRGSGDPFAFAEEASDSLIGILRTQSQIVQSNGLSKLIAVGEIGLDYFVAREPAAQDGQRIFLRKILKKIQKYQELSRLPLILHIRDSDSAFRVNHIGVASAHRDAVYILREFCPSTQKIYLHCFEGRSSTLKLWAQAFPSVTIGVSPTMLVGREGSRVVRGTMGLLGPNGIPIDHILVETDAPILSRCRDVGSTFDVCQVSRWLASVRCVQHSEIQKNIRQTFLKFFGLPNDF